MDPKCKHSGSRITGLVLLPRTGVDLRRKITKFLAGAKVTCIKNVQLHSIATIPGVAQDRQVGGGMQMAILSTILHAEEFVAPVAATVKTTTSSSFG